MTRTYQPSLIPSISLTQFLGFLRDKCRSRRLQIKNLEVTKLKLFCDVNFYFLRIQYTGGQAAGADTDQNLSMRTRN